MLIGPLFPGTFKLPTCATGTYLNVGTELELQVVNLDGFKIFSIIVSIQCSDIQVHVQMSEYIIKSIDVPSSTSSSIISRYLHILRPRYCQCLS